VNGVNVKGELVGFISSGENMMYRKKPIVIEAHQIGVDRFWPDWFHQAVTDMQIITHGEGWGPATSATIRTLEGDMHADKGDFIIKGIKGEFYPCKPDIFEMTYEAVEP
jgi:hypothetical protein